MLRLWSQQFVFGSVAGCCGVVSNSDCIGVNDGGGHCCKVVLLW